MSQYNNELGFYARLLSITYNKKQSRPESINGLGINFIYDIEKSSDFYSHYESDNLIIVAAHGALTSEEIIQAVGKFLSPSQEQSVISAFCSKYRELKRERKEITLVGHSLGSFAIAECSIRYGTFKSFLFAPYNPTLFSAATNKMRSSVDMKKILYKEDYLANNLIKSPSRNTLIFSANKGFLDRFSFSNIKQGSLATLVNSHGISNFTKSPEILNKDLVEFIRV